MYSCLKIQKPLSGTEDLTGEKYHCKSPCYSVRQKNPLGFWGCQLPEYLGVFFYLFEKIWLKYLALAKGKFTKTTYCYRSCGRFRHNETRLNASLQGNERIWNSPKPSESTIHRLRHKRTSVYVHITRNLFDPKRIGFFQTWNTSELMNRGQTFIGRHLIKILQWCSFLFWSNASSHIIVAERFHQSVRWLASLPHSRAVQWEN